MILNQSACVFSVGYFLIQIYFIFGLAIDYRDPYRHAIRELEEYTSPRKETPQLQR